MITCANQICLSRVTRVVTRRKSIMFNSFLTIDATSLLSPALDFDSLLVVEEYDICEVIPISEG